MGGREVKALPDRFKYSRHFVLEKKLLEEGILKRVNVMLCVPTLLVWFVDHCKPSEESSFLRSCG